jgi:hypothetical protein
MRTRGAASIAGIHAVTACNALHHAYLSAADAKLRLLLLLQAVGWMGQFRTWSESRESDLRTLAVTSMEPAASPGDLDQTLSKIFEENRSDPDGSASRVFRLAAELPARQKFLSAALGLTLSKADEVHYYKYMAALIEDIQLVSPEWQPHMLAAVVHYMKGSKDPQPAWAKRAAEALPALQA